jgi:hypothetical protein
MGAVVVLNVTTSSMMSEMKSAKLKISVRMMSE